MSSLLSAISGKFSTAVVLGTFFPVTVFVFLARVLWVPLLPQGFRPALLAPLAGLDDRWELFVLTLVTIVLSGLLYNLNTPVLRLYEGYPWKDTWLGRRLALRHRQAVQALEARRSGLFPLRRWLLHRGKALRRVAPHDPRIAVWRGWIAAARSDETAVRRELFANYPKESSVLPSRFGNVIRSFENYPERQYGMFAITLWPRLIAVVEPAYAETIGGAKSGVDFMINGSLLASLLALLLLATGLVYPAPLGAPGPLAGWLAEVVVLLAVARWLYVQAIGGALVWGSLVRGAFDLYRGRLLEKLGYSDRLSSVEEERALWRAISDRLAAGDPPPDSWEVPQYSRPPAPSASADCTSGEVLTLTRGVVPLAGGGLRVKLRVRRPEARARSLATVTLTDSVPDGFAFLWESAAASAGELEVSGVNPFHFRSGEPLAPGASLEVEYSIVPVPRGASGGEI